MKRYLAMLLLFVMVFVLIGGEGVDASTRTDKVTNKVTKVYVSAHTKSKVVGTLNKSVRVSAVSHNGSWDKVYVGSKVYFTPKRDLTPVVTRSSGINKITNKSVNAYVSASTKANVFKKYSKGTKLVVYSHNSSWDRVLIGSKSYYIPKSGLSLVNNVVVKKSTMYLKNSTNIYVSNRISGKVFKKYNRGTKLIVSKHNSSWHKVYISNKVYYIPSKELSSNKPVEVPASVPTKVTDSKYDSRLIPNKFRADGTTSDFVNSRLPLGLSSRDVAVRKVDKFVLGGIQRSELGDVKVVYKNGTLAVEGDFSWADKSKGIDVEVRYGDRLSTIKYRKMLFSGNNVKPINTEIVHGRYVVMLTVYYDRGGGELGKARYGWFDLSLGDLRPGVVNSDEINYKDSSIVSLANSITRGKGTQVAQSRAIYEWVARNVSYDIRELNANGAKFYSAQETLRLRTAMCTGYANLSAALHRAVGIDAVVVYGNAGGVLHAWNEVKIGSNWYFQDPTWASGYVSGDRFTFSYSERFFNVRYPSSHSYQGTYKY